MMEREAERSSEKETSRRRASGRSPAGPAPDVPEEKPEPDRIRVLAYEIYETRNSTGMLGDAESDWLEAERRLAESETPEPGATGKTGGESPGTRSARNRPRRQPPGK